MNLGIKRIFTKAVFLAATSMLSGHGTNPTYEGTKYRTSAVPNIEYRLPGDLRAGDLKEISGIGRRTIVHALTFHEVPSNLTDLIENYLPQERELEKLKSEPIKRAYINFTVYSLMRMTASNTITSNSAWQLFHQEWINVGHITKDNFAQMRGSFYRDVQKLPGLRVFSEPLKFEFWAREGDSGLAKFDGYSNWSEKFVFDEESCSGKAEPEKEEYRKAIWLDMRAKEGQLGISGLKKDLSGFVCVNDGVDDGAFYNPSTNSLRATIDIFYTYWKGKDGTVISLSLHQELGHWFTGNMDVVTAFNHYNWTGELMDRMYTVPYSSRVNIQSNESGSPEVRVFYRGGYYLASSENNFPSYSQEYSGKDINSERHAVAEKVDRIIRLRLERSLSEGVLENDKMLKTYRTMGLYVILLNLEGKTLDRILEKIEGLDLNEINDYYENWRSKAISGLSSRLKDKDSDIRVLAAKHLIELRGLKPGSDEYMQLQAYVAFDQAMRSGSEHQIDDKLAKFLGEFRQFVIPVVRAAIESEEPGPMYQSVKLLGLLGGAESKILLKLVINTKSASEYTRELAEKTLSRLESN